MIYAFLYYSMLNVIALQRLCFVNEVYYRYVVDAGLVMFLTVFGNIFRGKKPSQKTT